MHCLAYGIGVFSSVDTRRAVKAVVKWSMLALIDVLFVPRM